MSIPLNTRDSHGIVHNVERPPNDITIGRTRCDLFFTWPLYGYKTKWTGTEEHATCLRCVICP
jgi:hypothetical protein